MRRTGFYQTSSPQQKNKNKKREVEKGKEKGRERGKREKRLADERDFMIKSQSPWPCSIEQYGKGRWRLRPTHNRKTIK